MSARKPILTPGDLLHPGGTGPKPLQSQWVTIRCNPEHEAPAFWKSLDGPDGDTREGVPAEVARLQHCAFRTVTRRRANEIRKWCGWQSLWDDAAPALLFVDGEAPEVPR